MMKISTLSKFLLTGIIYAISTCIVQVPIANLIFSLLKIEPDSGMEESQIPWLLLTILIVGIAMAIFYYFYGHLFPAKNKWIKGLKFSIFIYFSNYIPQVFFLDATNGIKNLLTGGFPVMQVELFDFLILVITVLAMVQFLPCCYDDADIKPGNEWVKNLIAGLVFAVMIFVLNEIVLPIIGFSNMADGLNVSHNNKLFFYIVMFYGFWLAGFLVAYMNAKTIKAENSGFIWAYISLIWCVFDLTMIPLGYGVIATILFVFVSFISMSMEYLALRRLK